MRQLAPTCSGRTLQTYTVGLPWCTAPMHTTHLQRLHTQPLPPTSCSSLAPRSSTQPGLLQQCGTGNCAHSASPSTLACSASMSSAAAAAASILHVLLCHRCTALLQSTQRTCSCPAAPAAGGPAAAAAAAWLAQMLLLPAAQQQATHAPATPHHH
jgi:hypothetical protein